MQKPATLDDARRIIERISGAAYLSGYMLALYGSTLANGRGRDIDVFSVPWRPGASPDSLFAHIEACGFLRTNGRPYQGAMRTQALVFVEQSSGLLLDLQVREASLTP